MGVDGSGEDTRMAPVSREDVDLRRGRGAIVGALPCQALESIQKPGQDPFPFVHFIRASNRWYPRPAIDAGGRAASCAELESAFRRRPDAVRRSNARRSGAQSGGSGDRVRVANPNLSARLHENGRIGRIATISGNPRVAAGERESGAVQSDSWRPRRSHAANRVGPHLSFA
jgi:hypothetical protein